MEMSKCITLKIKSRNFYLNRNLRILENFSPQNVPPIQSYSSNIPCNYHFQMYKEQHLVHSICSLKHSSSQHQGKNTGLNRYIADFKYEKHIINACVYKRILHTCINKDYLPTFHTCNL